MKTQESGLVVEVFLDLSQIESLKFKGVLDAFHIPYQEASVQLLADSDYSSAPVAVIGSKRYEQFWGCVLGLDSHFWDGRFQFEDPEAKAKVHAFIETCEQEVFPVLFSPHSHIQEDGNSIAWKIKNLWSWMILSDIERRAKVQEVELVNLNWRTLKMSESLSGHFASDRTISLAGSIKQAGSINLMESSLLSALTKLRTLLLETQLSEFYQAFCYSALRSVLER
ncbi:MAG: hypothetical protein KDD60_06410, partial [Bdellovibrionales bacterium]|nr:hypothetical protein [Bdellovibrionales bacterium]